MLLGAVPCDNFTAINATSIVLGWSLFVTSLLTGAGLVTSLSDALNGSLPGLNLVVTVVVTGRRRGNDRRSRSRRAGEGALGRRLGLIPPDGALQDAGQPVDGRLRAVFPHKVIDAGGDGHQHQPEVQTAEQLIHSPSLARP